MTRWMPRVRRFGVRLLRRLGPRDDVRVPVLLDGYRTTCLIVAAVRTGVIDALGREPSSDEDLARSLGAHLPSLRRLLRGLRVLGLVERVGGMSTLTTAGRSICEEGSTIRDSALLIGEEYLPAWGNLGHTVLTGETAFDAVFGQSAWQHRAERPDLNDAFNRVMARGRAGLHAPVLVAFDFSRSDVVVDVGGGHGRLLAGILSENPRLSGILFDQPHVLEGASPVLREAGVLDRCRLIGGSFFDAVPAGGDVYVLRHILHDWDDAHSLSILRACRSGMQQGSSLLIIDNVMPDRLPEPYGLVMRDLHMMAVPGGRERTLSEFDALLRDAGLDLVRSGRHAGAHVLEAQTTRDPAGG